MCPTSNDALHQSSALRWQRLHCGILFMSLQLNFWRYTAQLTTSFFQIVAPHTARRPSAFDIRAHGPQAHSSLRRA